MSTAFFSHPDCKRHEMGAWHPESPERLQAIDDQLIASRISDFLEFREAPLATLESLARVHTQDAIKVVREHCPGLNAEEKYFPLDADTSLNAYSWQAALRAAGAAVAATNAVLDGEIENAFCAIRPPGHHAMPNQAMGFCLFNNVAIAAKHALQVRGLNRVAIIDFDVHHGNGTEAAFQDDPQVLMVSIFQHPFYPYSGADYPASNMKNVPVPAHSKGELVRKIVSEQWLPALREFKPEMLFISAGFDAHREDDMAQLGLVEDDYAWITRQLMNVAREFADRRIVSCLEGGYNLSALGRSVVAHLRVLAEID